MNMISVTIIFDPNFDVNFDHIYKCNESVGIWSYNGRYVYAFLVDKDNSVAEIDDFIERSTYRDHISLVTF